MKTNYTNFYSVAPNFITRKHQRPNFSANYQTNADTISFSANPKVKYVDENIPFLENYKDNTINNFNEFSPEKMVLVHMTDYFPENAEITPVNMATLDENGKSQYRSTVHFAINHSVAEHDFGNKWQHMKYAIILPMDKVLENTDEKNVLGGKLKDFFIMGKVKLPDGSIIIKHNPEIQEGKLKITDASKALPEFKDTKEIKIIETSNTEIGEFANKIIEKTGYTNFLKLTSRLAGLNEEEEKLLFDKNYSNELRLNNPEEYLKKVSKIDIQNFMEIANEQEKSWIDFAEKQGFENCLHTYSVWGRSEFLIEAIKLVGLNDNTWEKHLESPQNDLEFDLNDFDCDTEDDFDESSFASMMIDMLGSNNKNINYKEEFLKIIDEIKSSIPDDKKLSYNIDVLEDIIKSASTPSQALKQIEDRLGLNVMVPVDENTEKPSDTEIFSLLDTMLCITDEQKAAFINTDNQS